MPITNQFLWQFEIFDFFVKIAKFEFGPILEVNFWKIEFLEASSPNFPWSSPESLSGSAKIISWTFGIRKKIHWKYWKSAKIGGSLKIFQNLGPCNSRMGLFCLCFWKYLEYYIKRYLPDISVGIWYNIGVLKME